MEIKVYLPCWLSNYQLKTISVKPYDSKVLKYKKHGSLQVGDLCFNPDGEVDIVKEIYIRPPISDIWNPSTQVKFENCDREEDLTYVTTVRVKYGKKFKLNGKIFKYEKGKK